MVRICCTEYAFKLPHYGSTVWYFVMLIYIVKVHACFDHTMSSYVCTYLTTHSVRLVSLHVVVCMVSEQYLATRYQCSTLLSALSEKTFGPTVVSVQSTKTLEVMSKTADILEECKSFPTAAKQLRGKCF